MLFGAELPEDLPDRVEHQSPHTLGLHPVQRPGPSAPLSPSRHAGSLLGQQADSDEQRNHKRRKDSQERDNRLARLPIQQIISGRSNAPPYTASTCPTHRSIPAWAGEPLVNQALDGWAQFFYGMNCFPINLSLLNADAGREESSFAFRHSRALRGADAGHSRAG